MRRLLGGRPGRARVLALGSAVTLVLGGGVVTAIALPRPSASTAVLKAAHDVTLITPTGLRTAARPGQVVAMGDALAVAAGGAATLVTGPRTLLLAAGSRAQLLAPDLTEVVAGDVVAVDPSGRTWSLLANDITVSGVRGSVRIDRDYGVRVATYLGSARIDVTTGATLTLSELSQAAASQSALPAAASPLALIGDGLDRAADPQLLSAQDQYDALAAQINADPFVEAAYRVGSGTAPSERVLPVAIGAAAASSRGTGDAKPGTASAAQQAASHAAGQLRAAGGSWSVVAARLGAVPPDVRTALAVILDGVAAASSAAGGTAESASAASAIAALANPAPAVTPSDGAGPLAPTASPTGSAIRPARTQVTPTPASPGPRRPSSTESAGGVGPSSRPAASAPAGAGAPSPGPSAAASAATTGTPSTTPSTTPSASPTPTPTTNPGLVGGLLDTVGGLLAPSPSASATTAGLLGGVLGH